jgi:hypothetical protein
MNQIMASSRSSLSLFVLILFNGCFSWPIFNQENLTSTSSPFNNQLTTEITFSLRSNSDHETSSLSDILHEHMPMNMSDYNSSHQQTEQQLRTVNEVFTSSPITVTEIQSTTLTTEHSHNDNHHHHHHHQHRQHHHQHNDDHDHDDNQSLSWTTFHSTTDGVPVQERSFDDKFEHVSEVHHEGQVVSTESTTENMLSSTSTENYVNHLNNDNEHEHHHVREQEQDQEQSIKPIKSKKVTSKSKFSSFDQHFDESSTDTTVPTAVLDQEALKKLAYVPDHILILDENNTLVVTDMPNKWKTSTILSIDEAKPLNQGKESLHIEKEESHN